MNGMELFTIVQQVIAKHFLIAPETIRKETRLVDDLGADSLDYVDLLMAFEDAFEVDLKDEAFEQVKTVNDILIYLQAEKG